MDANIVIDSNVVDTNQIVQQTTQGIQDTFTSQDNIQLATNLFNAFVQFVWKQFSDALVLLQKNALVYGIVIIGLTWAIKSIGFDRMEQLAFVPDLLKWFISFLIVMALSFVWIAIVAGFVQ